MILQKLGIYGWKAQDENLLRASLLTGDPLLLIGNHGCAKTPVANKVAQALGRKFLVYDASKAMSEDGLGYPNMERLKHGYAGTAVQHAACPCPHGLHPFYPHRYHYQLPSQTSFRHGNSTPMTPSAEDALHRTLTDLLPRLFVRTGVHSWFILLFSPPGTIPPASLFFAWGWYVLSHFS